MNLPRMMHADVQFQIYRLEQMAMGGALAFDADELRNACHLIRTLATELDATAAPVVVGEDAAILKAVQHSDAGLALAYMIRDDVKLGDFRDAIVGAVRAGTAALAGD